MIDFLSSYTRRCKNHDYHSRSIYMITILKDDAIPPFSVIEPDLRYQKIVPIVKVSPIGRMVYDCLDKWCAANPALRILCEVAMPDHLHFEVFVTERTEQALGSMVAAFKCSCTQAYREMLNDSDGSGTGEQSGMTTSVKTPSLFKTGFNDKIVFRAGAKDAFYNYIMDNPRRYLVKKLCPEYFYHKVKIEINGMSCGLYGNLFLLDNPVKSCVKISRIRERTPDLENKEREWEETIRCGGALVSPFINPAEKEYRDKAIENAAGLILIVDYRFSERSKPYKSSGLAHEIYKRFG